jgi:hypothetical protein
MQALSYKSMEEDLLKALKSACKLGKPHYICLPEVLYVYVCNGGRDKGLQSVMSLYVHSNVVRKFVVVQNILPDGCGI